MTRFVKVTTIAGLGLACLTLSSLAQNPAPPTPAPGTGPVVPVEGRFGGVAPVGGFPMQPPGGAGGFGGGGFSSSGSIGGMGGSFGLAPDPLDGEARKIAKQLAEAKDPAEREKARDHLKDTLNKQFD